MTMTTTARPQPTTPVTLGVTDPDAIATFLRPGVPCDDAFWRRVHYECDHCHSHGTTVCGALWRVSLSDDCTELYYLHTRCLTPYKQHHELKTVEGRVPLAEGGGGWRIVTTTAPPWGPVSTLYTRDGQPATYAAGPVGEALLARLAERLNSQDGRERIPS